MKWDLEPAYPPPSPWPGPIALIGLAVIIALIIFSMGCSSEFYPDGRPKTIRGDYTYSRSAAGAVTITLKHSPVIRAAGVATTQGIAAAGTAASAALLAR